MTGPAAAERKKGAEETPIPITVVPMVRVGDRQAKELREGLARISGEIASLKRYSEGIRTPPTGMAAKDIIAECDMVLSTLDRMKLSSLPVLGARYADEIEIVRSTVLEAKKAVVAGKISESVALLEKGKACLGMIGRIVEIESGIAISGIPPNIRIPGLRPEQAIEEVYEAVEYGLHEMGTQNEGRAHAIWGYALLYSANGGIYNVDNGSVGLERDNILNTIIIRYRQAKKRIPYAKQDADADKKALGSFGQNLKKIKSQIASHNIKVLAAWEEELKTRAKVESDAEAKKRFQALQYEVETMLGRMRKNQEIPQDEMRGLMSRYMMLTGTRLPESDEETAGRLFLAATELRGSAKVVVDNTREWFGQQAIMALRDGNLEIASLAIAMGELERSCKAVTDGARHYLPSYRTIHETIEKRLPATSGMLGMFSMDIRVASVTADADRLVREYSGKGTADKRQRILLAAAQMKKMIEEGDLEGARRLQKMTLAYADFIDINKWKDWTGSKRMEQAIDAEISGGDGQELFLSGAAQYEFTGQTRAYREIIKKWGPGISDYRKTAMDAAARIEELAEAGKVKEAESMLTLLTLYMDCVEKLGIHKGGFITSVYETGAVKGMDRALRASLADEPKVDEKETGTFFMDNYRTAQAAYVGLEAKKLEIISKRSGYDFGRDAISKALEKANDRAAQGDYRGAQILLDYAREFYGMPVVGTLTRGGVQGTPAKDAGWRYELFNGPGSASNRGFASGRRDMIDAIGMEISAGSEETRISAARMFDAGNRRVMDARDMREDFDLLSKKYNGETPLIEYEPDTKGEYPLGKRKGDKYEDYVPLSIIRLYENNHPDDPVVQKGPDLAQCYERLKKAASSGDRSEYIRARKMFIERLGLVASRTAYNTTIDRAREQLGQMDSGMRQLYDDLYKMAPPAERADALKALGERRTALAKRIDGLVHSPKGEFPTEEYAKILVDYDHERRIAVAYSVVGQQLELNTLFYKMVASGQGTLSSSAEKNLIEAKKHLENALLALSSGDLKTAESEFKEAMYQRRIALGVFNAANALTFVDSSSWKTGLSEMWKYVTDNDAYWRDSAPLGQSYPQYEGYQSMQTDAFHTILFGEGTESEGKIADRLMSSARLVELSVFSIPANNMSQSLSNFIPDQLRISENVRDAVVAFRAGDIKLGNTYLKSAEATWKSMSDRAADNQWWGNAATITAALAANLIPGEGWIISGSVFTTMAFERVVAEYSVEGKASPGAWANLAFAVATMGVGAAAQMFKEMAQTAEAASQTSMAAKYMMAAKAAVGTNIAIGAGFTIVMGNDAIVAFSEGRTRDGILLTGMALFPWAHMGGARAWEGFSGRGARGRGEGTIDTALDTLVPSQTKPDVRLELTETPEAVTMRELRAPERMFRFLQDLAGKSGEPRALMLEKLPPAARESVLSLLENRAIRTALEGNKLNDVAAAAINRTLLGIGPEGGPSGGPGGRGPAGMKPETSAAAYWFNNPLGLADFLGSLSVPDISPSSRTSMAANRAVMKSLRTGTADERSAAGLIDAISKDADLISDIASSRKGGALSPKSIAKLDKACGQLANLLPIEAEQVAVGVYLKAAGAEGMAGPIVIRPGAPGEGPTMIRGGTTPRASAGDGGGPGTPVPGMAGSDVGTGGGGSGRTGGGGPRGPRGAGPDEAPKAPEEETDPKAELRARLEWLKANEPKIPDEADLKRRPGEGRTPIVGKHAQRTRAGWKGFRKIHAAWALEVKGVEEQLKLPPLAQRMALSEAARRTFEDAGTAEHVRERAAGAGGDAERLGFIKSATSRTMELMKTLYRTARAKGTPKNERIACDQALVRIFSYDNVRGAMEERAVADPEMKKIYDYAGEKVREAARTNAKTGGIGDPVKLMRQGMIDGPNESEIMTMDDARIKSRMSEITAKRAKLGEIEEEITKAETTVGKAQAELAAAKAKGGKAERKAEKKLEAARRVLEGYDREVEMADETGKMVKASEHVPGLREQGAEIRAFLDDNQPDMPLTAIEEVMGKKFSPQDSETMIKSLMERGLLPKGAALEIFQSAHKHAVAALDGNNFVTRDNPVADAMRADMWRNAGNGNSLDTALLSALRSPDVADAVGAKYGLETKKAFTQAVDGATDLKSALENISKPNRVGERNVQPKPEIIEGVERVVDRARTSVGDDFFKMEKFKSAASGEFSGIQQGLSQPSPTAATPAYEITFLDWLKGKLPTWEGTKDVGKWIASTKPVRLMYERGVRGGRGIGAGWSEFPTMARGAGNVLLQIAFDAAIVAGGYYGGKLAYAWYEKRKKFDDPMAYIQVVTGGLLPDVKPEDAKWANTDKGKEFITAFFLAYPADFPAGRLLELDGLLAQRADAADAGKKADVARLDKSIEEILAETLGRTTMVTDPMRIGDILNDGRRFAERLDKINSILKERKEAEMKSDAKEAAKKDAELDKILLPLGVSRSKLDIYLKTNGKDSLAISDIPRLKDEDWKEKGYLMRYCDAMAEKFLTNAMGAGDYRNHEMVRDLADNPYIFLSLWKAWYAGNIPGVNLQQAIATVFEPDNLAAINMRIKAGKGVDETVKAQLKKANQYVEVTGDVVNDSGETVKGTMGIASESLLGILERRMVMGDGSYKDDVTAILKKYSWDPDAMAAFNAFVPRKIKPDPQTGRIMSGETLYGDPMALANLIAANIDKTPEQRLELARAAGYLGPAVLGDIDPTLLSHGKDDKTRELIAFASRMSTDQAGVLKWIAANSRSDIAGRGNLAAILMDLLDACDPKKNPAAPMTASELYKEGEAAAGGTPAKPPTGYLVMRVDYYKSKGWFRGQTASEKAVDSISEERGLPLNIKTVPRRLPTAPAWDRPDLTMAPDNPEKSDAKLVFTPDMKSFFEKNPAFNTMAEEIFRNLLKMPEIAVMYPQGIPDEAKTKVLDFIYRLLVGPEGKFFRESQKIPMTKEGGIDATRVILNNFVMPSITQKVLRQVTDFIVKEKPGAK